MTIADKISRAKTDLDNVYAAGKTLEYDRMWDKIQHNGGRTKYTPMHGAFNGWVFSKDNFYPKYDIRPIGNASNLFYAWEGESFQSGVLDLKQRLLDCGVVLDTSQVTVFNEAFAYSGRVDNIPTLDLRGLSGTVSNVFSYGWDLRKTIEKIIVNENIVFNNWFLNCTGIETVIFEGTIGQSGLDMGSCTLLNKASITSIVNCLSTTASSKSVTLSKTAVNSAFTTAEWTALADTRPNWTISLV